MNVEAPAHHLSRTARQILVLAATAALMFGVAVTAAVAGGGDAGAVGNGSLGIRPATESDFFHFSLYPGAATDATAIITNQTSSPTTLLTYPVDGATTPDGRFTLAAQKAPRTGVGAWVQLDTDHITVPANAELKVPFRLSVPVGTPPGDYAGGLIIQSPLQVGKTVNVAGQTAVQLNVVQRQGVRIYLQVAGTALPTLHTGALAWRHTGNTIVFSVALTNTGNTILHPTAAVSIRSRIGATTSNLPFDTPESVLPGATVTLHARLNHAPLIELGHAVASVHSEAGTAIIRATVRYLPWGLLAAAGALLAALTWFTWRLTRFIRRARRALVHTASAPELNYRSEITPQARHRAPHPTDQPS